MVSNATESQLPLGGSEKPQAKHLFLERPENLRLQLVGQPNRGGAQDLRFGLGLRGDVLVAGAAAARVVVGAVAARAHRGLGDQDIVGPHHLLGARVGDVAAP